MSIIPYTPENSYEECLRQDSYQSKKYINTSPHNKDVKICGDYVILG